MGEAERFHELMTRVRTGDDQAAEELVRRYESTIRMAVRVRLEHLGLRRLLDSVDICQSVLANFFVRAATGQFDLESPTQLVNLLVTMAKNRLVNHARHLHAAKRDERRRDGGADPDELADPGASPSKVVANRELLAIFRSRLSEEELALVDLRAGGSTWPEVAQQLGGDPNALRFQLTRALDRVSREMHLEGEAIE